jgi:hypothetical protein
MKANFVINNEKISISWDNEIGKGVAVYVSASTFTHATVAVEVLLKQMGYYHLWYGSDVIWKAGIFYFEIVEVKEAEAYNLN